MECPICHHLNNHVVSDSPLSNCSQCGSDLAVFHLLNEGRESCKSLKGISLGVKKSHGLNKVFLFLTFLFFLLVVTGGVVIWNSIKNYSHVSNEYVKRQKVKDENIQSTFKDFQKEFKDYKNIQSNHLNAINEAKNQVNKLEEQLQQWKTKNDLLLNDYEKMKTRFGESDKQPNRKFTYIHYNGKDNLWNLARKLYGKGKYFLLFLHLNPFLKTGNNSPSYIKVLLDLKAANSEYQEITIKDGATFFYRYTVQKGDNWPFIFWRFKTILKGKKDDIIKMNNREQEKTSLTEGMMIRLPLK